MSSNYIFGKTLGTAMGLVDERTQYEASMMSMFFMLIGLLLTTVFVVLFTEFNWWIKGMTIFNAFWGLIFMWSYLVTTFQQYQSYMEIAGLRDEIGGTSLEQVKAGTSGKLYEFKEVKGGNDDGK